MKSSIKIGGTRPRFQPPSKGAQRKLHKYEHTVICLMVLIAVCSIVWSFSIHILSGDFLHGIIGAKLGFRPRDFSQLDDKAKEIFHRDLQTLLKENYAETALETRDTSNMLMLRDVQVNESQTIKPQKPKIVHLFQTNSKSVTPETEADGETADNDTIESSRVHFNVLQDRTFLETMTTDVHQTRWQQKLAVQFIYNFPFLSEIISIIWAAMCLVFQTAVKPYWGLPKPWRIVVPSILIFFSMSLCASIYAFLAHIYVQRFCTDLKSPLTNPSALSCGQAISLLRPVIVQHRLSHDVYLKLFRISYLLTLTLWMLALLVISLRFILAVDFQLTDVPKAEHTAEVNVRRASVDAECRAVLLNSSSLQVGVDARQKSEDDFQSAKSHQSEPVLSQLEASTQQPTITIYS